MGFCAEHAFIQEHMITAGEITSLKMVLLINDEMSFHLVVVCREFISQLNDKNIEAEVLFH